MDCCALQRAPPEDRDVSAFPTTRGSSILRVSLSPFGRTRSFLRSLLLLCDGARHVILADFLGQHRRIAILCPLKSGNERRLTRYLSLL